jgi:hypothetical protein
VSCPAGPQPRHRPWRSGHCVQVPDPRQGRQVHQGVRRRVALSRCQDHPHTGAGAQRQRGRRAMGRYSPPGVPGQLLIVGRKQLVRVLRTYVGHYNQRRPHRSLAHATPVPSERAGAGGAPNVGRLRRRDVLGGLIHEYEYADDTLASGTPRAAFLRTRDRSPVSLSGAENSLTAGELPARTAEPLGFRPSDHGAPADRRLTGSRVLSVYRAARTVRGSFATTSS